MAVEPLNDQAYVIRGGLMVIITLRIAIDTCMERQKFYGLSFFGENGLSVDETARLAGIDNRRMRVSTVGAIRSAGFQPIRSGEYPHLSVRFEVVPTDDELERLVAVFDDDIPNPYQSN
jgi:hypothetical protein